MMRHMTVHRGAGGGAQQLCGQQWGGGAFTHLRVCREPHALGSRRLLLTPPVASPAPAAPTRPAGGELATAAEHDRLRARLRALPTSEEEDQALLDGGTVTGGQAGGASGRLCNARPSAGAAFCAATQQLAAQGKQNARHPHAHAPTACRPPLGADWRDRAFLQWRVMRKRALRQTLERLAAALRSEPRPPPPVPHVQQAQGEDGNDGGEEVDDMHEEL